MWQARWLFYAEVPALAEAEAEAEAAAAALAAWSVIIIWGSREPEDDNAVVYV